MHDAYRLGASLYVPATHPKLDSALRGARFPDVRSLIACTEDAVSEADIPRALAQLRTVLPTLPPRAFGPLRFIRPRNVEVLEAILAMRGVEHVHGFVIPKADTTTLPAYAKLLAHRDFLLMPTLETPEIVDAPGQRDLRHYLQGSAIKIKVLALRIGGNDLLRLLTMKRTRGTTIYETPVGLLIQQLLLTFRPHGFHLTAPVYDFVDDAPTLLRETRTDVAMGLIGKTAIHPDQVAIIERALAVSEDELSAARQLLAVDSAVFKFNGAMLEPTVHTPWAQSILVRKAMQDGV